MAAYPQSETCRLEQCLEGVGDNRGKTPPLANSGVDLIEINALEDGHKFVLFERVKKFVTPQTYATWFRAGHPRLGDTLISTVGAIGRVAYINYERGCIAQNIIALRPKSEKTHPEFLYYLLASADTQHRLGSLNIGVAQPSLKVPHLLSLSVVLPPLPVQRSIAAILSAYDDLIENNTRRIQILERMAQALYREWFVNFRFPGHAQVKLVASPLGKIPQGWSVQRLDEVANVNASTIRRGHEPENIFYVDIASVTTGRIEKIEPMTFADAPGRARRIVQHGDTIWSCVRPNRKSFSLILNPSASLIVSTGFAVLTPTKVPFSFLHQAVTTDNFVSYLTNNATGAAYPAITAKDFEAAKMLLPDESLLRRFNEHCEPMLLLKENLMRKKSNLRRTRDLLLPKLISGALDASGLDIEKS